jgi:hypothetical protein
MASKNKSPERLVAMGCRCQLLTGSYNGATRSCDCVAPFACRLSLTERLKLADHPQVNAALLRNRAEFNSVRN